MNSLSTKIKAYGQQRLANDSGIGKSMISQVVHGKKSFSKKAGAKVSRLLDIPLAMALGMIDD